MNRKTRDEEIRRLIRLAGEWLAVEEDGSVGVSGHIDFSDCAVWFDENGYTVIDRHGRNRAAERVTYSEQGGVRG